MGFSSLRSSRHLRLGVGFFLADFLLVWLSFALGSFLRFEEGAIGKLVIYAPGVALSSLVLPAVLYVGGLYSPTPGSKDWLKEARWLLIGLFALLLSVLITGSLVFDARVGRGVLFVSLCLLVPMLTLRHLFASRQLRNGHAAVSCVVASREDEAVASKLFAIWDQESRPLALVTASGYEPVSSIPVLASIEAIGRVAFGAGAPDAVLVRDRHFATPSIAEALRSLRYEGTEIFSLSDLCEDSYQAVPLELVTDSWLFRASQQSQLFYIRKVKRLSDLFLASLFLLLLAPFFGFGALLVRLSSPGPLIFRQQRAGRFGRPFTLLKLRTMHESGPNREARWATDEQDRIFWAGRFLRAFRIDEIPQLLNVLRGEMSFVGPRPEQVAMVDELSRQVPFYRERLLIQPGITGWAQVKFPYGGSVEDAARKLEYDLYYMKHMGLFLDFFILLETVKTVLSGGHRRGDHRYLHFRGSLSDEESVDSGGSQHVGQLGTAPAERSPVATSLPPSAV